jgi:hypothetical protein
MEQIINNVRKAGRPIGTFRKSQEPKEKKKAGRPIGTFTKTKEEKLKTRREWMKEHYKTDMEAHERQKERMRNYYNKIRKIVLEAKEKKNIEEPKNTKPKKEIDRIKYNEEYNKPFTCECGITIKSKSQTTHRGSNTHRNIMKTKSQQLIL